MEFNDFFNLMKPVLGKERANAKLVRNLIAMITKTDGDVDPSQDQSDETLKSYANGKRPLSPEYARGIIAEVEFQNSLESGSVLQDTSARSSQIKSILEKETSRRL